MAIIARDTKGKFSTPPQGLHQAVCIDVVDKGNVETQYGVQHKVILWWALEALDDETGKPYLVRRMYTNSLNEKATLCQHLEMWRGRKFTTAEKEGFDLEVLIGHNCQVQVTHDPGKDGRVWANVQAVVGAPRGLPKLTAPRDYVRYKDRPENRTVTPPDVAAGDLDDDDIPF